MKECKRKRTKILIRDNKNGCDQISNKESTFEKS